MWFSVNRDLLKHSALPTSGPLMEERANKVIPISTMPGSFTIFLEYLSYGKISENVFVKSSSTA